MANAYTAGPRGVVSWMWRFRVSPLCGYGGLCALCSRRSARQSSVSSARHPKEVIRVPDPKRQIPGKSPERDARRASADKAQETARTAVEEDAATKQKAPDP